MNERAEQCPACGAPCVYKYCVERAHSAEILGNDEEFLNAYREHAKRLQKAACNG